jgi:hypothetical protein
MADTHKGGSSRGGSKGRTKHRKTIVTAATAGAAIGIGSAALVAALLYSNQPKRREHESPPIDPRFEPGES